VPGGGVEPPRPEGRRILSPLRIDGKHFKISYMAGTRMWKCESHCV